MGSWTVAGAIQYKRVMAETTQSTSQRIEVAPGPGERTVVDGAGRIHEVPDGWELLAPGDAGLTRRLTALGPTWAVRQKRGRRTFSQGVWAPAEQIARARAEVEAQRADPRYQRRRAADKARRELKQVHYAHDFHAAVEDFLYFHKSYAELQRQLAKAVSDHATPVGSGSVARTQRIGLERRAEAAVIAWMRHQTTAYDDMEIARVKGRRREVRRELAERSRALLDGYRRGDPAPDDCPLAKALRLAPGALRSDEPAREAEASARRRAERDRRRAEAGLPPTTWPVPALERPPGGWTKD